MKSLIILLLAVSAQAQNTTDVHEVAKSTQTQIQTISISSSAAIDVEAQMSSAPTSGYFALEVYNLSGNTPTLNCSFDVCVSTDSTNACYGREIAPGNGVYWAVGRNRKLRCRTQSTTAATRATISVFK